MLRENSADDVFWVVFVCVTSELFFSKEKNVLRHNSFIFSLVKSKRTVRDDDNINIITDNNSFAVTDSPFCEEEASFVFLFNDEKATKQKRTFIVFPKQQTSSTTPD